MVDGEKFEDGMRRESMKTKMLSIGIIFAVSVCSGINPDELSKQHDIPSRSLLADVPTQESSQGAIPMDLLDPTVDYMFKQIFGQNEDNSNKALKGLLSSILGTKIESVHLENTEISKILENDKTSRLDIRAKCNNNTELNIEMQCKNTGEIPERAFHYLANMVPTSLKERETYQKVKYVTIWILKENVTSLRGVINEARMCFLPNAQNDGYTELTDKGRIFFIELEKYKEEDRGGATPEMQGWLSFLTDPNAVVNSTQIGMQEALGRLQMLSKDRKVREEYNTRIKTINDHQSEILTAEEKGRKEEREKAEKEKAENAKKMLKDGLAVDIVAKYSGLTINEVKLLQ